MAAERCVIFNPAAGKHRAGRRLDAVRQAWGPAVEFLPTAHAGHATELARDAARAGVRTVVAAGGDGTAHEVVNGLMQADRPEVRFALLPVGSANDYAYSLNQPGPPPPGTVRRVDVGRVRTADAGGRERFFACNLGLGFNGHVTRHARRIRRLQGVALYGLAALRALLYDFRRPVMEIRFDDAPPWTTPTLLFSALVGQREGGFVLAPRAAVDDGWLDTVHAGALSRLAVLGFLPRLALFGPPADAPHIRQGRCKRATVRSPEPLLVHTDGEFFCLPEDGVHAIEIDLLPAALAVETLPEG